MAINGPAVHCAGGDETEVEAAIRLLGDALSPRK